MKKKFLLLDIFLVLFAVGVFVGWLVLKNTLFPTIPPKQVLSPEVNKLTYTVNVLSGSVERVSGNTIYLSVATTEEAKQKTTYMVHLTDKTSITLTTPPIRYLFRKPKPSTKKIQASDLKPGQYLMVSVDTDIRSINSNELTAVSIAVVPLHEIVGVVSTITNNTVLAITANPPVPLFAFQSIPTPAQEERFLITITPDTEISRYKALEENVLNTELLTVASIKEGMYVRVFTDNDLTFTRTAQALRIEPLY